MVELRPKRRVALTGILPNALTVIIVAGIMIADVIDGPVAYWKIAAWSFVWLCAAAACVAGFRR